MDTYISLLHYLRRNTSSFDDILTLNFTPIRLDDAKKIFQSRGAELKQWLWSTGKFDAVVISEGKNVEEIRDLLEFVCRPGNIEVETFHALTENEFRKIATELPELDTLNRRLIESIREIRNRRLGEKAKAEYRYTSAVAASAEAESGEPIGPSSSPVLDNTVYGNRLRMGLPGDPTIIPPDSG
jgi:uncharacterized protein with GYD domain